MRNIAVVVCCCLMLFSCAWVKVSSLGEGVRLVQSTRAVQSCKRLGNVNARVVSKFVFDRDAEKVAAELANLARNEAALLGGDTIVPITEIHDGRRRFGVYQCFKSGADRESAP
ncbi:protein of unknown function [Nitrosomonas marina]|uniref:DUF4156 domain-containing protein n=1 Tax=Nitrosomonas marina TaxID=917 RepID=A0A1I0DWH8_9PROT|nr:DUF4156 domain-containing protein [Nitrosomonas marina]SET37039.1 protein of unknown function [Nitrosomonas marina]